MKIQENILLKDFTTLHVGGKARYFAVVKDEEEILELLSFAKTRKLPIFILGGGSNLLISDYVFPGLIIKNEIKGIKFDDEKVSIGSGESLDDVISLSIIRKLAGLENLSGIPGTVGGSAVQNAGAYGVEFSDHLFSVEGINLINGKKFCFPKKDCRYGYRTSIFKNNKKFFITAVLLNLNKDYTPKIDYAGIREKFGSELITLEQVREVILAVRQEKLPDWHKIGTAGSFFKNPVISESKYLDLKIKYPDLPGYPDKPGQIKLSLAWILDKICGLKGFKEGNVALYEKQPLVLVNLGGATEKEIFIFSKKIKKNIFDKTGIEVIEEVEKLSTVL